MTYLPEIIGNCLDLMSYELRNSNIEVTTDCAGDVPPLYVDVSQLQQVFLSLVENACLSLAAVDRHRRIEIGIERAAEDTIRIQVTDNGVGIPAESIERVFDPFFTTREVGEGTGLGLTVAYGIVREHGGSIHADRGVPVGARIVITLPTSREPSPVGLVVEDAVAAPASASVV